MKEKSPLSQPSGNRRRNATIIVVGAIGLWWLGVFAYLPRRFALQELSAQHLDKALTLANYAIAAGPASASDQILLSRIQRKQGNLEAFEQSLAKALELGATIRSIEIERLLAQAQSGRIEGIQSQLDRLLVTGESDGREVLEAYVNGCLAAARLTQAATLISGWEKAFPDDGQPNYYRGRLLMFYGKNTEAAAALKLTLQKQPDHFAAAYLLGQILLQENRPEEALIQFRLAQNMSHNAACKIAESKALRSLGHVEEARKILQQTVKLSAEQTRKSFQRVGDRYEGLPAQMELGNLELAINEYEEAVKWLDEVLAKNPGDLSSRHARGIALRGAGRTEEAARELQAVKDARIALREVDRLGDMVNKNPNLIEERVRIAELYITHESKLTGEYWLKTALARAPTHKHAHSLLAELYDNYAKTDKRYAALADFHRQQSDSMTR